MHSFEINQPAMKIWEELVNKEIVLRPQKLCILGTGLLALSNLIWCWGWLNVWLSVLLSGILVFCYIKICTETYKEMPSGNIRTKRRNIIFLLIICIAIAYFAGIGGGYPQFYDHIIRNPIFRDLIFEKWPVVYNESNAALTYYLGFWMLPALLGKIAFSLGVGQTLVWNFSNVVLLILASVYLYIFSLLLLGIVHKIILLRHIVRFIFCFLAFGGISVIGFKVSEIFGIVKEGQAFEGLGIEHYSPIGTMNNFFLMLGNVFNQMLPVFLCVLIFLYWRKIKTAFFLLSLILLTSPYPAVGMFLMMLLWFSAEFVSKQTLPKIKDIINEYNVFALLWAVVIYLFYRGNSSAAIKPNVWWENYKTYEIVLIIFLYHICMWFCYYFIVFKYAKEKALLKIAFVCFLLIPLGVGDFNMRAILPAQIILFLEVYRYLEQKNGTGIKILLAYASISPIVAFSILCQSVGIYGTVIQRVDPYYTLSNLQEEDINIITQYVKYAPEKDIFFKYLSSVNFAEIEKHFPAIEYALSDGGERYIHRISVFSDEAIQLLKTDVSEESLETLNEKLERYPQENTFEFEDKEIGVRESEALDDERNQVKIIWNNVVKNVASNKTGWTLDLTVENIGADAIYVGKEDDDYRTGVVATLYSMEGEKICDLGYVYTNKTIFAGDSKRVILTVNRPQPGSYWMELDYFCDYIKEGDSKRGFNVNEGRYIINVK